MSSDKPKRPLGTGAEATPNDLTKSIVSPRGDTGKGFWTKALSGKVRPAPIRALTRCDCPGCRWWDE